eukprot:m.342762 g.342762  ORF g.342762 m.342762 type:complete len:641 (+) comp21800_c0_seq1:129-2051(+)
MPINMKYLGIISLFALELLVTRCFARCDDNIEYQFDCPGWSSYCQVASYRGWMQQNCARTCGFCAGVTTTTKPPTTTAAPSNSGNCARENVYAQCADWERAGYCNMGHQFMNENCYSSCYCKEVTTTTTPMASGGSCKEDIYTDCAAWASYCTNDLYSTWMQDNCYATCENCDPNSGGATTTAPSSCQANRYSYCENLAAQDYCNLVPDWMDTNCQTSCKCSSQPSPSPTPTPSPPSPTPSPPTPSPSPPAPTPSPPAPAPGPACIDSNTNCAGWAASGFCSQDQYATYLRETCYNSCYCQNGPAPSPPSPSPSPGRQCRLRRSWYSLNRNERRRYTSTVRRIAMGQAGYNIKRQYDELLKIHIEHFTTDKIHEVEAFLPWHRWYLIQYENILRQVEPDITVPFWPWETEPTLYSIPFWDNDYGFGELNVNEGCVNGPFAGMEMAPSAIPVTFAHSSSQYHMCISREGAGQYPSRAQVMQVLNSPPEDFDNFHKRLDAIHGVVHCNIGGTMCSSFLVNNLRTSNSANAPEFFVHHAQVDRLWSLWQDRSYAHANSFDPQFIDTPMLNGGTPREALNRHNYMGVCVEYEDIGDYQFRQGDNVGSTCPSEEEVKLFEKWLAFTGKSYTERQERVQEFIGFMC